MLEEFGVGSYPELEPRRDQPLTVSFDNEAYRYPTDRGSVETKKTGRKRIVIEGEAEFVDKLAEAMNPTLAEILRSFV